MKEQTLQDRIDLCRKQVNAVIEKKEPITALIVNLEVLQELLKRDEASTAALALLNQHLKGRTYTDLDDALRNMLQAFISLRGLAVDDAPEQDGHVYRSHDDIRSINNLLDRTEKYMTLAGIVALKDSMNPMEALLWDIRETQGKKL